MKEKNIKLTLLPTILSIFLLACSTVSAQQPDLTKPGSYSVKTAKGYIFIRNGIKKSLRFDIVGEKVEAKEVADNPGFLIDGRLVQILFVPRTNFEPTGKVAMADLLETHRKWESEYLANEVFGQIKTENRVEKIADRDVLFWWFSRPKYVKEFDRDIFATTLFGDDVFGVSSPVAKGSDYSDYRKMFDGIFRTLQIQDEPFDVEKISDEIRNNGVAKK